MRRITHICIHHSLTKDSGTVSWGAIADYHTKILGWRAIGYHYGVEKITDAKGQTRLYALVGRPETWVGAAVKEQNSNEFGIHICVVGNFNEETPTDELYQFLARELVLPIMDRYGIMREAVVGHRDFADYKTCPGENFDLDRLRNFCS